MKRRQQILMVRWGGLGVMRNVATLANVLSRSGFTVKVLTVEGDATQRSYLDAAVEWESLGFSSRHSSGILRGKFAVARRLRAALRREAFDLLYLIDSWTLPVAWLAGIGSFPVRGKPWVFHTYDWLEPGVSPAWAIWLERKACRAAALVVNTDRSRARLQRTLYRLKSTPLWIPNCLSRDEVVPERSAELRKQWFGTGNESNIVLIYPSIASGERLTANLIEAFGLLPDKYRLVTFVAEDGYGRACRDQVVALGLQERVRLLAPVSYQKILEMAASADLGGVFHDSESSSGYFMANADRLGLFAICGVPIVASDYPNLEAVVYRNGLGVCCNAYSAADIAAAIQSISEDPDRLAQRRKKVRAAFEERLHFEKEAGRLVSALEFLLERRTHDGGVAPVA